MNKIIFSNIFPHEPVTFPRISGFIQNGTLVAGDYPFLYGGFYNYNTPHCTLTKIPSSAQDLNQQIMPGFAYKNVSKLQIA